MKISATTIEQKYPLRVDQQTQEVLVQKPGGNDELVLSELDERHNIFAVPPQQLVDRIKAEGRLSMDPDKFIWGFHDDSDRLQPYAPQIASVPERSMLRSDIVQQSGSYYLIEDWKVSTSPAGFRPI